MKVRFFLTNSGRSPIEEFLATLSKELQGEFFDAIVLLAAGEKLEMPLSRNLSSIARGLHELRLKDSSGIFRFFYFIKKKDGIYLVHAFKKKSQKLPQKEIDLILKRIGSI